MLRNLKQFNLPEIEEKVLKFWKESQVFQKSLDLRKKSKPFRFFEGPPTANGRPGLHHVLARAFKDIVCRYKTMKGYFVSRRAGWDTHGLPVELEIEKKLGLKNKQEIEKFGIAEFNAQAKMSVWTYKSEWEKLTERIGFWLDFDHPYVTYENSYIESLWWVFGEVAKRGLLKKLYKIVPWCPRCQTPLSSHELGQPGAYKLAKDPSVYVKFKLKKNEYLLVWTTTPWTLPANVAVAVNPKLTYTKYKVGDEYLWSYSTPPKAEGKEMEVIEKMAGKRLVGMPYDPLYKNSGEHKVISADFISTEEGTGLVHIAPAFGEDDLRVAGKGEIPVTIDDRGMVNNGLPGAGKFIKEADADISKDLEERGLLYHSGTIEHEYPFCWRCSTPLIYFARNSWFIEMSKLKEEMIAANKKINWIPSHIKEGRFGEWLKDLKDWSISRNRYWGTPIPIWECEKNENHRLFVKSLEDLNKHAYSKNNFFLVRHCESNHNIDGVLAYGSENGSKASKLTEKGIGQAEKIASTLKKNKVEVIYSSPFARTLQTAKIIAKATGAKIVTDKRLSELNGGVFNDRPIGDYYQFFKGDLERFTKTPPGGENLSDIKKRMMDFLMEINKENSGKNVVILSHGDPLWILECANLGLSNEEMLKAPGMNTGEFREIKLPNWPFNKDGELDIHRPFVDEVYLKCPDCAAKMTRIKDVADVWFDSGAMPWAQWHYPFENKKLIDKGKQFPADYIAEGMDQTRGWFYTLLAVSTLLGKGLPYRNVISFGLLLDKNGQKMSKSKGNVVDPWQIIQKYGSDVARWYFYTVNSPGEPKRFDENDLRKTLNKLFMLAYNSFVFYSTYGAEKSNPPAGGPKSKILDEWILARLNETVKIATENLENYAVGEAAHAIEALVNDLSRWYIRRSRKNVSGKTLEIVLEAIAKLMAPFVPFFSEALWLSLGNKNSIHLEDWPNQNLKFKIKNSKLLDAMSEVRRLASLVLAEREKAGIKVRQPLRELRIKNKELGRNKELLDILADEINVKEIIYDNKLKGEIELDTKITPELRNEGIMRELMRTVQGLRHDAKYNPADTIALYMEVPSELRAVVEKNLTSFKKDVKAKTLEFKKTSKFDAELTSKLEEWPIWIAVRKI